MSSIAAADRYDRMSYRYTGRSGLKLPVFSLGLWQNFGDDRAFDEQRAIVRRAFDLGITHFDLANNYGPPYGAAESAFGRMLAGDLAAHRDEIVVSTKAGWDMWPGPYGAGANRKHLLASLDQSLGRLGIDYVDIFYSHRPDPGTPLEETAAALDRAVRAGKALYVGISSYSADSSRELARLLGELGTPLLIHQPSYSMLNRWVETDGLLDVAEEEGFGVIGFTALAQGLLTGKYLGGVPAGSRAAADGSIGAGMLAEPTLARIRGLDAIARRRGQSLAQMALAWALRDDRVTSLVIGASRVSQLEENVAALEQPGFSAEELAEIDAFAGDAGVDLWADARGGGPLPSLRP